MATKTAETISNEGTLAALPEVSIDLSVPASRQIADVLRPAILRVQLPPGCRISEVEVGAFFGVSRTPAREALSYLVDEGLVVTLPSRGNFVSKLSEQGIRQAQFLREGLELMNVIRLCETVLSDVTYANLRQCLELQAKAQDAADNPSFHAQDDRFHSLLARATGFARAETLLVREKSALDRLRYLSLSEPPHLGRLIAEHTEILDAIVASDTERAAAAVRVHLRSILGALSRLAVENREFFQ